MEITLRFDEIIDLQVALETLVDQRGSPEFAVRVAQAIKTVGPVAQSIQEQRNTILEETCARDSDGEPVFTTDDKTEYLITPHMRQRMQELFDSTTTLQLPPLPIAVLRQNKLPFNTLAAIRPLLRIDLELRPVTLIRSQCIEAVRAINELGSCRFANPDAALALSAIRHVLIVQIKLDDAERLSIVERNALRDAAGEIIYTDADHTDFEVAPAGITAMQAYNDMSITLDLPRVHAADLRMHDDSEEGTSTRAIWGLLPLIEFEDSDE